MSKLNLLVPPARWRLVSDLGGFDADLTLNGNKVWAKGYRVQAAGNVSIRQREGREAPGTAGGVSFTNVAVPAGGSVSVQFDRVLSAGTTLTNTQIEVALSI